MSMWKFINNLFCKGTISKLKEENKTLKENLQSKQDVINQTNAYWKRKLYNLKKNKGL